MLRTSNKLGIKEPRRSKEMQELVDAFKGFKIGFAVKKKTTKRKRFLSTFSTRGAAATVVAGP